jgi:hypothetical protein
MRGRWQGTGGKSSASTRDDSVDFLFAREVERGQMREEEKEPGFSRIPFRN